MSVEFEQIVNGSSLYLNNLVISNNAVTPNTKLNIASGICRDSSDQLDINIGNYLGLVSSGTANVSTVLNFGVNGLNGLDTGSIAATKMYYIYAIADASNFRPSGLIASLAVPSVGPLLPFGYSLVRWIGCWPSDGSSNLLLGLYSGMNNEKTFWYDASRATGITAGTSGTYAQVDMTQLVPFLANVPVIVQTNYTANAAADTLNLQPQNGTGDAVLVIAQVAGATAHIVSINKVLSTVLSTKVGINYKVSAGSVAINVNGFDISL